MKQMSVAIPILAVLSAVAALLAGAAWWVAVLAFLLTAPVAIVLVQVICGTFVRCDTEYRPIWQAEEKRAREPVHRHRDGQ